MQKRPLATAAAKLTAHDDDSRPLQIETNGLIIKTQTNFLASKTYLQVSMISAFLYRDDFSGSGIFREAFLLLQIGQQTLVMVEWSLRAFCHWPLILLGFK